MGGGGGGVKGSVCVHVGPWGWSKKKIWFLKCGLLLP